MKEINWSGTLYLSNLVILITVGLMNLENMVSCWETSSYRVWVCTQSFSYWIAHITFIIWAIWTLYIIIDLIFFEWEEAQHNQGRAHQGGRKMSKNKCKFCADKSEKYDEVRKGFQRQLDENEEPNEW